MQRRLTFHLTADDIEEARRYGNGNQLLYLLSNRTGTLWSLDLDGTACEIMAPYRRAQFWVEVDGIWQPYQGQALSSLHVRAEIEPPREGKSQQSFLQSLHGAYIFCPK